MLNEWVNISSKILELILTGERILFVKLAWQELLEAKIYLFPTQPDSGQLLSDSCTCHVWTPGSSTDNKAQNQGIQNFSEQEI